MPVLVERVDTSKISQGKDVSVSYLALINEDSQEAAVLYDLPTGEEPILSVKFDEKNKKEVLIYAARANRYLPVWNTPDKIQIAVSDENEDEFPQELIATLTSKSKTHSVEIKRNGKKTGSWVIFRLIDADED